jgi:hypothetical protein
MDAFMLLAMLWATVNAIPPALFFVYWWTRGWLLRWCCTLGQWLSLLLGAGKVACLRVCCCCCCRRRCSHRCCCYCCSCHCMPVASNSSTDQPCRHPSLSISQNMSLLLLSLLLLLQLPSHAYGC